VPEPFAVCYATRLGELGSSPLRERLPRAAVAAAAQLGLFDLLREPHTAPAAATHLGVGPRRLRRLLDALVWLGVLRAQDDSAERWFRGDAPPTLPESPPVGTELIVDVLRRDAPYTGGGLSARLAAQHLSAHELLGTPGPAPVHELAERLAPVLRADGGDDAPVLLDAGGGHGAYTAALLGAVPTARAVLVDQADVLEVARRGLRPFGPRVALHPADLLHEELGSGYAVALLSEVLHLHAPPAAAAIVQRVAAALRPGGTLCIKDLALLPDRSGPGPALWFSFGLALFSPWGEVHDREQLAQWLRAAGLGEVPVEPLRSAPSAVVLLAQK
jgi:SAM-dependent methyltransferase